MNIRQERELWESQNLSSMAVKSIQSKGREVPEAKCNIRTEFQRDRDRILHSKAFRRLKHKTQVYISPDGDHYRTRLTHTLEVSQIARTIGRALRLNEDLVEAIALAHDLGHTPFGHMGEAALNRLHPGGFTHYRQSIRVVEFLESNEKRNGLNLTYEVKDGIANHSGSLAASTSEGQLIKFSDRIAYVNHDIDDALRAGTIKIADLPKSIMDILGWDHSERIHNMVNDVVTESAPHSRISMSQDIFLSMMNLRQFLFDRVYDSQAFQQEARRVEFILSQLYRYYKENVQELPKDHFLHYQQFPDGTTVSNDDIVTDYIAGMTDQFAEKTFIEIFMPHSWQSTGGNMIDS